MNKAEPIKILIMGLPGSGKTYFAEKLQKILGDAEWFNADKVREKYDDWDFSDLGRLRQATRMRKLCETSATKYAIADFVCPTHLLRAEFNPDWIIWMDTIDEGRFEDTNKKFKNPDNYDFRLSYEMTEENADKYAEIIADRINGKTQPYEWDNRKETVQMLGRWQPWHLGHQTLFEKALAKHGQVVIMIRDCQGWNDSNPFDPNFVKERITRALDMDYKGRYKIMVVPNIVNITYGRDVGYKIEQEHLGEDIEQISATKIRKEMGIE